MTDARPPADSPRESGVRVETTRIPLSGIYKVGARRLSASWTNIPHVTHHDEADVTELEASVKMPQPSGNRSTLLAEVASRVAGNLVDFPRFNSVLDDRGSELLVHDSIDIGFAIDTAGGLVVGVVRNCDRIAPFEIAAELQRLAEKARSKGLSPEEMVGGSLTISSLGKDGGIFFTPIVNAPQVAILGVSSVQDRPRRGPADEVLWRRALPLSLSYDHRAINGADAARFMTALKQRLLTA